MKNEFFERDTGVARIESAGKSVKLDDEFFNRDTEVARVPPDGSPDDDSPGDNSSPTELKDAILENAKGPKRVQGDSGSVEQHSLKDQIEAERFLQSKKAARGKGFPVRLFKISPDGPS